MVMERQSWNIPGIAFALDAGKPESEGIDYTAAAQVAHFVTHLVIRHGLPKGVFFNVNIPYVAAAEIRGVQLTRQGSRVHQIWLNGHGERGLNNSFSARNSEEGTDVAALTQGYVSVTPLQLDLTTAHPMPPLAKWNWSQWKSGVKSQTMPVK